MCHDYESVSPNLSLFSLLLFFFPPFFSFLLMSHPVNDDSKTQHQDRDVVKSSFSSTTLSLSENPEESVETHQFLSGVSLWLVIVSFTLLTVLIGLDLQIPASSVVAITSQFDAISYISWITSTSLVVETAFIPFFGKVLIIAPAKIVLFVSAVIFEIGSLYCATAQSCSFFIFGRALAGLGASGMWVATLALVPRLCDVRYRHMFIGILSMTIGVFSIMGTVIAGAFSSDSQWRWCYYINLPIGGIALVIAFFKLPNLPPLARHEKSALHTWMKLDWIGTFLLLGGVFLLLTGLQWGGNTIKWSSPEVILTLVFGPIMLFIFILWEIYLGPKAIIPLQMFKKRNIVGCLLIAGVMSWARVIGSYYIPVVYQLRGVTTNLKTVLDILPTILSIVAAILSRFLEAYTGYIWIWLLFPPLLSTVAYSLLSISYITTTLTFLAAFQILIGFASGAATENCTVRAQAEHADDDKLVTEVSALITFVVVAFSAIGLSVCGAIFSAVLHNQVNSLAPNLPPSLRTVILQSIKNIPTLPSEFRPLITEAYLNAINQIFLSGSVISFAGGIFAFLIKRKTMSSEQLKSWRRDKAKKNRFGVLRLRKVLHARYFEDILRSYKAEPYIPLYDMSLSDLEEQDKAQ